MPAAEGILASARHLAHDVPFPDAMRVDRLDALPDVDALASTAGAQVRSMIYELEDL